MKTYNYSEAQQNYSMVLNTALRDDVFIRRKVSTGKIPVSDLKILVG
jgi:hypothetical protein